MLLWKNKWFANFRIRCAMLLHEQKTLWQPWLKNIFISFCQKHWCCSVLPCFFVVFFPNAIGPTFLPPGFQLSVLLPTAHVEFQHFGLCESWHQARISRCDLRDIETWCGASIYDQISAVGSTNAKPPNPTAWFAEWWVTAGAITNLTILYIHKRSLC